MPHTFEPAASGRSKCRGCKQPLAKGEVRFGERMPNPFGEGDATLWFHPRCAAYRRPQAFLEALAEGASLDGRMELEALARATLLHERLVRIDGAERSPSGQAHCRHCREPIERGAWRIRLALQEEGTVAPGGFIHLACREPYFGHGDVVEHVLHFSPALDDAAREELRAALR